jgi:redox-sensing transcriptional repressor
MGKNEKISPAVIRRLPKYYRYLGELSKVGVNKISSRELSDMTGFSASQIRQDLNNFGGFGQQGFGYDVENLRNEIGKILGLDKKYKIIIVGAGNIGQAIANYTGFYEADYEVVALFDKNPKLIGLSIRNAMIMDSDDLEDFNEKIYFSTYCCAFNHNGPVCGMQPKACGLSKSSPDRSNSLNFLYSTVCCP